MASKTSQDALRNTDLALKEIAIALQPFLDILSPSSSSANQDNSNRNQDPSRIALAKTVVALSLGTLRYMGNRLRGSSQGKNPTDPLRLELNRMRQTLVQVQNKIREQKATMVKSSLLLEQPQQLQQEVAEMNKRKIENVYDDRNISENPDDRLLGTTNSKRQKNSNHRKSKK